MASLKRCHVMISGGLIANEQDMQRLHQVNRYGEQ